MNIALVVPHIFMHRDILPNVIFSPGTLALDLAEGLTRQDVNVTLCTPGPVDTNARNLTADLSYFKKELEARGDTYIDLLKKHPLTFITLARQVQAELLSDVFKRANNGEFDIVHVYTNEEDSALPLTDLCNKPVVFTHHDPYNFLVKYRAVFPKYAHNRNWLSISKAQRRGMPNDTNWIGNIYHGLSTTDYPAINVNKQNYVTYIGRIIEPKGVHLAIHALNQYNERNPDQQLRLKIAGKHYSGAKDHYWQNTIQPLLNNPNIEYVGFVGDLKDKQVLLAQSKALIVPSLFDEPFGMVMIESLACGTPVIGLDSGAIPEIISHGKTGYLVAKQSNETQTAALIARTLAQLGTINPVDCRLEFEERFTLERMCTEHKAAYASLIK